MVWLNTLYGVLNACFILLVGPLIDGVERKIRARLQNRRGPSILQTWYDLVKLLRKPAARTGVPSTLFRLSVYIGFVNLLIVSLFIPSILCGGMGFFGDLILFIYLLSSSKVFVLIGSYSSGSPYASIGSTREVSLSMASELVLAEIIALIALSRSSLLLSNVFPVTAVLRPSVLIGLGVLGIIVYIEHSRLPFEIGEAEPELAGGYTIEYAGRDLGFILWSNTIRRTLLTTFLIDLIIPLDVLYHLVIYPVLLFSIMIVFTAIETGWGRLRIDISLKYVKRLSYVMWGVILLALIGY